MINSEKIKDISNGFIDYFVSKGYILCEQEPLIPINDQTLVFTNATIVPLKKFLIKSYDPPGFVVYQPCVRLWNIINNNFEGKFTSFFRMVSILVHPMVGIDKIQNEISEYISSILGISSDRIRLHYNSSVHDMVGKWQNTYEVIHEKFSNKFYEWSYGIDGVKGRGVTFFVERNGWWRELGNFVEITKDGVVVGYEFGFGIESCVGILNGYKNNFDVLFGENTDKKLQDVTCVRGVIEQALKNHKGKISGTTRSSIKKVDHELVYAICELKNGDCSYIKNMSWDLFDVNTEVVEGLIIYVKDKIDQVRKSAKLIIDYRAYIDRMTKLGKTEEWAVKKTNDYIRKNNYYRINDLINKGIYL